LYQFLADTVLVAHLAFIIFVLAGGLLLLRWPRLVWLHVPAVVWAVFIEVAGWVCPLTPLENYFRALAGGLVYQDDFVARYLLPLIYPFSLTPAIQLMLAIGVIAINLIVYIVIIRMRKRTSQAGQH